MISGIRGLFRSTGGVIGTAVIVLWLELSPDKAAGMRTIFTVLGLLMLATTPLVFLIPDSAPSDLPLVLEIPNLEDPEEPGEVDLDF